MTERWQNCSANVFVIASAMCFYNPDVRTAGEPRLAACPEKPEMPHQPNQQGNVSYTTPHSIPLIDNTLCTGTLGLYSFCIHRDEFHQLDDMINANIWDSPVDHQFHNYEHVSCHSAYRSLAYKFILFSVLMSRDAFTWQSASQKSQVS